MSLDAPTRILQARMAQARWARRSVRERTALLRSLRRALAASMDEIVATVAAETGKLPMDALAGDLMVTLEHLSFYERHATRILRPQRRGKPAFFFTGASFVEYREPFGVALVLAPWNYPVQLALIPAATALFAGNAVLLKCSERTPRTAALLTEIVHRSGLPSDLLQISSEPPDVAQDLLAAHPDILFVTGSTTNGRTLAAQAAAQLIPVVLELGGKDAAIVCAGCDLERTVNGLVFGSFSNAGQVCVATKRIYVEQSIYKDFLQQFIERAQKLRIGTTPDCDLPPMQPDVQARLITQVDDAVTSGAYLHLSNPTILTGVPHDSALLQEESFGAAVCVEAFHSEAEAVALANSTPFALGASVWTGDRAQGARIAAQLHCGNCSINDVIRNIGNPQAAFGGNNASGYGRYHGAAGLFAFSRTRSVMTAGRLQSVEKHWFPFHAKIYDQLRTLLKLRHAAWPQKWKALRK